MSDARQSINEERRHSEGKPLEGRRCVVCKTGVLEEGRKTLTLERGDTTIVIKQVPGLICNTCGEGYFDEDVTDRLLKLVEEAAAAGVEVDVRRYVPEGEEIDRAA